jgi:hypothetical protein
MGAAERVSRPLEGRLANAEVSAEQPGDLRWPVGFAIPGTHDVQQPFTAALVV